MVINYDSIHSGILRRDAPRATILGGNKGISEVVLGLDGTLCDTIYAVHVHCSELADSMPMDASTVALEVVDDSNLEQTKQARTHERLLEVNIKELATYIDSITPACLNPWAGVHAVEHLAIVKVQAVGVFDHSVRDRKSVVPDNTLRRKRHHATIVQGNSGLIINIDAPVWTLAGAISEPAATVP
jgi:hypothetical protein